MSRYAGVAKIICEASTKTPPNAIRFASTRSKYANQRPPQVGQRPVQPPMGELHVGGPVHPPRVNILDLTCQPCEFPPPTTRTPYRKPVAVNFSARKTSVSHRDSPAEKEASQTSLSSAQQTKEKVYRAVSDKTSKELVAKLQVSTRTMQKTNESLASCFKTTFTGRNTNVNK